MRGVYEAVGADGRREFEQADAASYPAAHEVLREIYDEVSAGNEISSVIMAGDRLKDVAFGKIDGTETWQTGKNVRAKRVEEDIPLHPFTAGVYLATMMAQVDILLEHGHPYSEIANESVIEAVDSLNPYMHARGVSYMVDNCSTTARLGSRKWAPRFDYVLTEQSYVSLDNDDTLDESPIAAFQDHEIHDVLAECAKLRPPVDIFVE
jgi:ketol-acid reductoisomerase